MQKLNKVFKCLKLKRDENNKLEFRKREGVHDFKLRPLIQHFIDEITSAKVENEDSNAESDDSDASSSDLESEDKKLKRSRSRSTSQDKAHTTNKRTAPMRDQSKLESLNSKINSIQYKTIAKEEVSDDSDDIGPKFEDGRDFLNSTLSLITKLPEVAPSKELEHELNKMFAGAA